MTDESVPPARFQYLFLLLQSLPNTIPAGNSIYRSYKPRPEDVAASDKTGIGALHRRLLTYFQEKDEVQFRERGEGLMNVVAALQDAYATKDGDKQVVRGWVEKLTASALAVYKRAEVQPPSQRRQTVPTERAAAAVEETDGAAPAAESGKRKAKASEDPKPPAAKKNKQDIPANGATNAKNGLAAQKKTATGSAQTPAVPKVSGGPPGPATRAPANAVSGKSTAITQAPKPAPQPPKAVKEKPDKTYRPPRKEKVSDDESDSEDENDMIVISDGESALRSVQEAEAQAKATGGRRGPKSTSLSYWHVPSKVVEKKNLRWEFRCKFCNATRTFPRSEGCAAFEDEKPRPPTANLTSHSRDKHPNAEHDLEKLEGTAGTDPSSGQRLPHGVSAASAVIMRDWLKEGKLNPEIRQTFQGFLQHIAAWIVEENLAFTTCESPSIKRLFVYLGVRYQLPSDTTVRNELARLYTLLHNDVVKELSAIKSRISYATDTWTTKQMIFTFAGTIASFINDDWELIERVVDFACLEDNQHEGVHAGQAFVDSAASRGGANKIFTMDNASVNDVLAHTVSYLLLKRYGVHVNEHNLRIRCLPHVVNLVVQKMLSVLNEADDPDVVDYFLQDKNSPVHYDPATDAEQLAAESLAEEDEKAMDDGNGGGETHATAEQTRVAELLELINQMEREQREKEKEAMSPVKKLRTICTKIMSSPQRRSKFRKALCTHYPTDKVIQGLMVVKDVAHRWNFTHAMMDRAVMMEEAIDAWVFAHRAELGSSMSLNWNEWEMLRHMRDLLGIFPDVTKYMCQSGQPTLPWVLPLYDYMENALVEKESNSFLPDRIRAAATAGLEKLRQYRKLAQNSHFNALATILHPGLRGWLQTKGLGDEAAIILQNAFDGYQKDFKDAESVPVARPAAPSGNSLFDKIMGSVVQPDSFEPAANEVERYMGGYGRADARADNALLWWKIHQAEFPILSRMARDFLAIPASSVSVERLFSESGYLVSKQRSSLNAKTIHECMCTRRWLREGVLDRIHNRL